MRVEIDSKVYIDLLEILGYYDEVAGGEVASDFYSEFRQHAKAAGERPHSFPANEELHRVNLRKFPHHFLFQIMDETTLRILLVRHNHRHPSFGLDRINPD